MIVACLAFKQESSYQSTVNALRFEATLPLRQVLPPGYHPLSSALGMNGFDGVQTHRRQPLRRSNRPVLLNGCSPHEEKMLDGSLEDESERSEDASLDADSAEVDGCPSDFSEVSISSSSMAWNASDATPTPSWRALSPGELAKRARVLLQWRSQAPLKRLQSRLPAFGPTCRVPFLPTASLRESSAFYLPFAALLFGIFFP